MAALPRVPYGEVTASSFPGSPSGAQHRAHYARAPVSGGASALSSPQPAIGAGHEIRPARRVWGGGSEGDAAVAACAAPLQPQGGGPAFAAVAAGNGFSGQCGTVVPVHVFPPAGSEVLSVMSPVGASSAMPDRQEVKLEVVDVEVTEDPPMVFFKICVTSGDGSPSHHVMKRFGDLRDLHKVLAGGGGVALLPLPIPRGDEELSSTSFQNQFSDYLMALVRSPKASSAIFQNFFQLSSEYRWSALADEAPAQPKMPLQATPRISVQAVCVPAGCPLSPMRERFYDPRALPEPSSITAQAKENGAPHKTAPHAKAAPLADEQAHEAKENGAPEKTAPYADSFPLAHQQADEDDILELAEDAEEEFFLNTCGLCGETWLLPVDIGLEFTCQAAGKPCGPSATEAAVASFLMTKIADGEAHNEAMQLQAKERKAQAMAEAASAANSGDGKRPLRYLGGSLVQVQKGTKYLVTAKETADEMRKTSCSIAIIGSRSKPAREPSKKAGPKS